MTYTFQNPSSFVLGQYIKNAHIIGIVGLSNKEDSASYTVAKFMQDKGYTIIPINPRLVGQAILGQVVYERLQDVPESMDIVGIFRRSQFLPDVARDFLETNAGVFWAQEGLENEEAEMLLRQAERQHIVMNRCLKKIYQQEISSN